MNRSLVPIAFFLAVSMAGLSAWVLNQWSATQDNSEAVRMALVHEEQQRLTEALDSWRGDLVDQLVARAEQQLELLPLPLADLSALKLRQLDTDLARWQEGPVTGLLVNLDPASHQFYFENREMKTNFMFLVAQGNTQGPTAVESADGFYFLVAAPLSQPGWAMVAQVDSRVGQEFFDQLRPKGYASLEQRSGAQESMRLARYGELTGTPETLIHPKFPEWRLRFHPSSTLLQYAVEADPALRTVGWALAGFALASLLAAISLLVYQHRTAQAEDDQVSEAAPKKPAFNPSATQNFSVAGAESKKQPKPEPASTPVSPFSPLAQEAIAPHLFRANDVRGIVGEELTAEFARHLGRAFAKYCGEKNQQTIFVCRDARNSSEEFASALIQGIVETGCDVVDMGLGPTPLLIHLLATQSPQGSGVMVTGSHNPPEYNGFKLVRGGKSVSGKRLQKLRSIMLGGNFEDAEGKISKRDFSQGYLKAIRSDLPSIPALRVVVDGANGSAGPLCVSAFRSLECTAKPLFCEPDGNFPNHGPDPGIAENLNALREAVRKEDADFGVALDGDGDRVVIVDDRGKPVPPDQLFMLFARETLIENPGSSLVFDVKASRRLPELILQWGGLPLMERAGRTFIQARVVKENACLGGELSSHYFFGDRWHAADDGIYAACRLAAILLLHNCALSELLDEFDLPASTPEISLKVGEAEKTELLERFKQTARFEGAELVEIDGLRVEYPDGWGLIRVSNTGPNLSLRFEANSEEALQRIQNEFRQPLKELLNLQELNF